MNATENAEAAPPAANDAAPDEPLELQLDSDSRLEAIYSLETWVRCPSCQQTIKSIGVVRLLRTRVNFVSGVPRRGYLTICIQCRSILPADIGGFL
jgi:hypothetical protein